jgi:ribosomal protein L24
LAGKYQDSENDKVVQQEHSLTVSKIDKEALNRFTEESRRLKFENENNLKVAMEAKAQLVMSRACLRMCTWLKSWTGKFESSRDD